MNDDSESTQREARAATLANLRQNLIPPVSAIVGICELLSSDADRLGLDDVASDLDRISQASEDLNAQVGHLLSDDMIHETATADGEEVMNRLRHDLRTPMNAIKGYSEMLIEDLDELKAQDIEPDLLGLLEHTDNLLRSLETLTTEPKGFSNEDHDLLGKSSDVAEMFANLAESMRPINRESFVAAEQGNILVVDDVEANRTLLARRLERDGHRVSMAEGGYSALEAVSRQHFDVVLLDLMMPDINGFDVLEKLKGDEAHRNIPVIMISALDEIDSVARCIEAGAEDYLPKPFNPVLLQARINAALEKKRWHERERLYLDRVNTERQRYETLLHNILPQPIVERLNHGELTIADRHDNVTVLFSDFVGFTEMSARVPPAQVVRDLNRIFSGFDRIAKELGVEKIKTIGDAYMVAAGVPNERSDHAEVIVEMAFRMFEQIEEMNFRGDSSLQIRIGVHSGPVVAGIIGSHRFVYDVWGDTVNVASRLETSGAPGLLQVSAETAKLIEHRFALTEPQLTRVKGKGQIKTHYVTARKQSSL